MKDRDAIREEFTSDDIAISGPFRNGLGTYSCNIDTSLLVSSFHTYSMQIDGVECGNNFSGISIVVYDNDEKAIIDKVTVNTSVEEKQIVRY